MLRECGWNTLRWIKQPAGAKQIRNVESGMNTVLILPGLSAVLSESIGEPVRDAAEKDLAD